MITASIKLDTRRLDNVAGAVKVRLNEALQIGAYAIMRDAIVNTVNLRVSPGEAGYGQIKNGWRVKKVGQYQYAIYNVMHYAIYHEMGTVHMSARPMLSPAVDKYRKKITKAFDDITRGA